MELSLERLPKPLVRLGSHNILFCSTGVSPFVLGASGIGNLGQRGPPLVKQRRAHLKVKTVLFVLFVAPCGLGLKVS